MKINELRSTDRLLPVPTRATGFVLSYVSAHATRAYARAVAAIGLTPVGVGVLEILASGPLKQAELSSRLEVFQPTMVGLINELEGAGLVERRPHPTDRRAFEVHLTPAGHAKLADAQTVSARVDAEVFGALTPRDRADLDRLLGQLAQAARTTESEEDSQ